MLMDIRVTRDCTLLIDIEMKKFRILFFFRDERIKTFTCIYSVYGIIVYGDGFNLERNFDSEFYKESPHCAQVTQYFDT